MLHSKNESFIIYIGKELLIKIMNKVSKRQLERYPVYLKYLILLRDSGQERISSPLIAKALKLSEEQVRKDLQLVSKTNGKPKSGRNINELISDIKSFLGFNSTSNAVVIGVGNLGQAFLNYPGFAKYGLDIVAGFDINRAIIGTQINHKHIYDMKDIKSVLPLLNAKIAILVVPSGVAQKAATDLVKAGIKAIWNYAPVSLTVDDSVVVENVNLASSLAILSHKLINK